MTDLEKNVREKFRYITNTLIKEQLTITTMESCTSGLVASLLTDTEGASAVLKGAFVTYSNEAKIKQNVPADVIGRFGVYSEETAREMALAAKRAYGADIAIGVTGTMGNVDPANNDSTPGEVFFAIAHKEGTESFHISVPVQDSRYEYKLFVAGAIAEEITRVI
ncbi:CinA family protein [Butyrivibrio sp. VCB2001]|uniref:CinA family protein n=1 Tax=Butyrivibrio sp. VCB2001 TaxID=1280667 RepID=UPI00047DEB52|nr:CinA family protein [Butyrivibrio sp. VCB2001]